MGGRGYKKHKSGAKGGVGRAGIWSHNKNARKFRVVEKRDYDHYLQESALLSVISRIRQSGVLSGTRFEFRAGGKTNYLVDYNLESCVGVFELDSKFKKVLSNLNTSEFKVDKNTTYPEKLEEGYQIKYGTH